MEAFERLKQTRKNVMLVVEDLSLGQLNQIPDGFRNSILWNMGHILVTQQALHYRLSGNEMAVSGELVEAFRKGSEATEYSEETRSIIFDQFLSLADQLEEDYNNGLFKKFMEYSTSYGYTVTSIEDSIAFNNMHEALHLGYIMAQRKLV